MAAEKSRSVRQETLRVKRRDDVIVVRFQGVVVGLMVKPSSSRKNVRNCSPKMMTSPQQQLDDDFEQAARYVLEKNKDLYDRLA